MLDLQRNINEFKTHPIFISMDDLKIFEVKCNIIPVAELPVGAKEDRLDTEFDRINP